VIGEKRKNITTSLYCYLVVVKKTITGALRLLPKCLKTNYYAFLLALPTKAKKKGLLCLDSL
jgi:hypothetical protein